MLRLGLEHTRCEYVIEGEVKVEVEIRKRDFVWIWREGGEEVGVVVGGCHFALRSGGF